MFLFFSYNTSLLLRETSVISVKEGRIHIKTDYQKDQLCWWFQLMLDQDPMNSVHFRESTKSQQWSQGGLHHKVKTLR